MRGTLTGSRVTTAVIGALVAGVLAVTALGFLDGRRPAVVGAPVRSAAATAATPSGATPTGASTPPPTAVAEPTTKPPTSTSTAPQPRPITATVVGMRAVTGEATQPGDVAGPAVRFTIRLTNRSDQPVDTANTVVNASYGSDQEPAYSLVAGATAFPGELSPGRSATGVFVFTVPLADRDQVAVTVATGSSTPILAFQGAAPRS